MSESDNLDMKSQIFGHCMGCIFDQRDEDCPFSEIAKKKSKKELFEYIDKLCSEGLTELQNIHLACKNKRIMQKQK